MSISVAEIFIPVGKNIDCFVSRLKAVNECDGMRPGTIKIIN